MDPLPPTEAQTRILLVDHETPNRETIRRILHNQGFQIDTATDRHEALDRLRQNPVSLVVMNMFMPHAKGIGTLIAIGGFAPTMKVIAMADGQEPDTGDFLPLAKSLGATALLGGEPLDPVELLAAVRDALAPNLQRMAC